MTYVLLTNCGGAVTLGTNQTLAENADIGGVAAFGVVANQPKVLKAPPRASAGKGLFFSSYTGMEMGIRS